MTVEVKLFAALADMVRAEKVRLELPPGSTGRDLRDELIRRYPALGQLAARSVLAVNRAFSGDQVVLGEGDEVALIPPVSGGSGQRVWLTRERLDARRVEEAVA